MVRNGVATNDLVLSAHVDGNENVFPRIMELNVKHGSVVADVSYSGVGIRPPNWTKSRTFVLRFALDL